MFIHWGVETYLDVETDTEPKMEYLQQINPTQLDTDQWVAVAESMGATYIILVAKHHGGFCLWPTKTTAYNISNTPWRDGQGDVLGDLLKSWQRRGMKLGVYVSPADFLFGAIMSGGGKTAQPGQQQQKPVACVEVIELPAEQPVTIDHAQPRGSVIALVIEGARLPLRDCRS